MDDPRLPVLCQPSPTDGEYRGRILSPRDGFGWFHGNSNVSRFNERVLRADQPIKILTHAEVEFNKAEIYLAGLASGNAQAAYQAGLRSTRGVCELEASESYDFM